MGFIESYIFITFMGFIAHPIAKKFRPEHKEYVAYWTVISLFIPLILDILAYCGTLDGLFASLSSSLSWVSINNGKQFMWNSFALFGAPALITPSPALDQIAILLFLSYTPWYVCIKDASRMLCGQKKYQEGLMWVILPEKIPKENKVAYKQRKRNNKNL